MMKEEKKNVPALRFPGFDGEWKASRLKENYSLLSGQHLNPDEYSTVQNGNTPYFAGPSDFTSDERLATKWAVNGGKEAVEGNVLITVKGSGVGTLMLLKLPKAIIGRQLMALSSESASVSLLHYILETKREFYQGLAYGNMIPGLSRDNILETKLYLPDLPEQQKIASFLTAVDEKLQALKKKKRLLEEYKKGVMQKIFSQSLRFKDDERKDFPDWEEKKLGEITNNISSGKSQVRSDIGRFLFYGSTGVIGYSNRFDYSGKTILIARVGANAGAVYLVNGNYSVSDNTLMLTFQLTTSIEFVYQYLNNLGLNQFVFGSGQPLITGGQLRALKINLPSQTEQAVIAKFLFAIDQRINNCGKRIEKAENWKNGLLQKVFT